MAESMMTNAGTEKRGFKLRSFPYKVDYNDHFETPLIAYREILPLLDLVAPTKSRATTAVAEDELSKPLILSHERKNESILPCKTSRDGVSAVETRVSSKNSNGSTNRVSHVLYDPYYCNGRAAELLESLGFANVQHAKRDFYKDIDNRSVPEHDTLVTNPPYSGSNKEKCLAFATENLRENGKSFFLLLPNYVANKDYYRHHHTIGDDIVYVIPAVPYKYDHPQGTGKDVSPFDSIWYCGIGRDKVDRAKLVFSRAFGKQSVVSGLPFMSNNSNISEKKKMPRLVCTWRELQELGAVPTAKRRNPKQRRKLQQKKRLATADGLSIPSYFCSKTNYTNKRDSGKARQGSDDDVVVGCRVNESFSRSNKKRRRTKN